ncbi:aspartate--tRNA ligase [Rubellicoccus peritrichatus]|uniref:Aspartate--tRNA(Asp/Asn) ligase n=1 Tax=Rubellicoccus peritrichatus TaxID=3080537 RepID=A0AAQ3L9B5_9BACT|nr:aspartate--tRNA ligase [Puniceicoccus sp. CR14]WOO41750.1 aspartate--tRNA ligase [Puniceicoccus sp. CR14]
MKRTHTCNQLTKSDAEATVTLVGWVKSVRDHGGVLFVDLRDRDGLTQVVFHPDYPEIHTAAGRLKDESVIQISGVVKPREEGTINPNMTTGEIEVSARELIIENLCDTLPFPLEDAKAEKVNEDLRLQYRYLDLRRDRMSGLLALRSKASKSIRDYLADEEFLEVETPTLFKSTPEGAREFLVPSRLNPGEFYALSQSPQQYKQMLMVAGVERYYSMARCYRDEDLRADRQPEFTQVDMEMSFIEREDMYKTIEGLLVKLWKDTLNVDVPTPFPRLTYVEAMNRFGSDKPDTRFGMELLDFSEDFAESKFKVFKSVLDKGGVVKAINAKGLGDISQGEVKTMEDAAKAMGAKGLAYIVVRGDDPKEWRSPILKFLSDAELEALKTRLEIADGDLILFAASEWEQACNILGRIRLESAQLLVKREKMSISEDQYNFLWVVDFPLMLFDAEAGRHVAAHHPFTAPVPEDIEMMMEDPTKARSQAYDIVLNGSEIGGGSIRIHQPELQDKVFKEVLKIPEDVVQSRFGYMLKAFNFGAPPHGGIALGFDRICAILGKTKSIREVIAFPKTQKGQDLMASAPGPATTRQLSDLHIGVIAEKTE